MSFIADVTLQMPLMAEVHERLPGVEGHMADYHRMGDESGASRYVLFIWMTGADFEEMEAAFEDDETVEAYEAIADAGDRRLYRLRSVPVTDDDFLLTVFLRDHGIALHEVVRDQEGLHLHAQFPSRESLQALLDALEAAEMAPSLGGIYSEDQPGADDRGLTDRQWDVLAAAAEAGYFETPSETTLAAIADGFDISAQAASNHLRAAVKKLVEEALESRGRRGAES